MDATPLSIKKPDGVDEFSSLRKIGMEHIQRLGKTWTDHNEHDPGVTILEQLCYALTDLHYRIDYDIPDLLAGYEDDAPTELFSPAKILTTNPVTITDLRKVILDIPEVRNAWIETAATPVSYEPDTKRLVMQYGNGAKHIHGLYKVWIDVVADSGTTSAAIISRLMERVASCRPLCEDFLSVEVIKRQKVKLKATIEIGEVDDPEMLIAMVYQRVLTYMSPSVTFYTLQEMQQKGYSLETIMRGPALDHGFIDDNELPMLDRKNTLFVSDIINLLYDVPGLVAIKNIQLQSGTQVKDWKLDIAEGQIPEFDNNPLSDEDVVLQKSGMSVQVDRQRVAALFFDLRDQANKRKLPEELRNILPPVREYRFADQYYSIQNHFPSAYALRQGELADEADPVRKMQRDQLRTYLLFFDQILADMFSQVAHLKDIFSYENKGTYFTQQPATAPEFSSYITDLDQYNALQETDTERLQRKNRVLNHLLARFGEEFAYFSLLLPNLQAEKDDCFFKGYFLQNYPEISGGRGCGINSLRPNVTGGLEKRIRIKMGMKDDEIKWFYLVEHILLRPTPDDSAQRPAFMQADSDEDVFSLHVSYVLSDTLYDQSALLQTIIREETPAHVRVTLIWLTDAELNVFDSLYKSWRNELAFGKSRYKMRGIRNRMIDFMNLGITYPISDLPIKVVNRIVPYSYKGKFVIEDSEVDVRYELYKSTTTGETKTSVSVMGTGENLLIETEELNEDSCFVVYAIKERGDVSLRVPMNNHFSFQIGIDTNLTVSLAETTVTYGSTATIQIADSQDKVVYKLFDVKGQPLSNAVTSHGGVLVIESFPLYEDIQIVLKASKYFSEEENEETQEDEGGDDDNAKPAPVSKEEIVNVATLPVGVMPDLKRQISVADIVLDFNGKAKLLIEQSQKSVQYQVRGKPFDENHILYERTHGAVYTKYESDISPEDELIVCIPAEDTYLELSPLVKGNGGKLTLETEELSRDMILFVRAVKDRNGDNDDVLMEQNLIVLLRPRMDFTCQVPAAVNMNEIATLVINDPERGVIYQLLDKEAKVIDQQIFHKNKPVEDARLGVDMVVNGYDENTVILKTLPIAEKSAFKVKAVRMYTRLASVHNTEIVVGINT